VTPAHLAALHARCFTTPRPWGEPDFAAFLQDPLAFLLTEGDAAFLLGRAVAGEAELLTLAVAPESRRLGLARKLVARFLYQSRLRAAETAFLEVAADNAPARALYAASGFTESGRRPNYYATPTGQRLDAILMHRALG
jgi:ribosomal-protein-alanine N-acetyltransferase